MRNKTCNQLKMADIHVIKKKKTIVPQGSLISRGGCGIAGVHASGYTLITVICAAFVCV